MVAEASCQVFSEPTSTALSTMSADLQMSSAGEGEPDSSGERGKLLWMGVSFVLPRSVCRP